MVINNLSTLSTLRMIKKFVHFAKGMIIEPNDHEKSHINMDKNANHPIRKYESDKEC